VVGRALTTRLECADFALNEPFLWVQQSSGSTIAVQQQGTMPRWGSSGALCFAEWVLLLYDHYFFKPDNVSCVTTLCSTDHVTDANDTASTLLLVFTL
jgi:hypothetical protein